MYVRCPGQGCKHLLTDTTIMQLASVEALAQRRANIQAANARRISNLASEDTQFLDFCASHTRKCPSCHVIIYRHAGCDHMTCSCGFEFDWTRSEEAKIGRDGRLDTDGAVAAASAAAASAAVSANAAATTTTTTVTTTTEVEIQAEQEETALSHLAQRRIPAPHTRAEEQAQLAAAIAASTEWC